ncbi:MAG: transposase [Erysipelotrichaceae bacterium]|nr:transposase [Erysipelotrichaceae bacterium]
MIPEFDDREISHFYFSNAKVCADSFHVLEHLTLAFRDIRLKCRRNTEDEDMQYLLTKFKYVFDHDTNLNNRARYNQRLKCYLNHRDILNRMCDFFPELKKAYELKEAYIHFNETSSSAKAREELTEMIELFSKSGIKEYEGFVSLLINWFEEIINSFTLISGKRINNSYIEARNRTIDVLLFNANGYTNFKWSRNRILYCLNKNDSFKL